jgi:hypothetical protein
MAQQVRRPTLQPGQHWADFTVPSAYVNALPAVAVRLNTASEDHVCAGALLTAGVAAG